MAPRFILLLQPNILIRKLAQQLIPQLIARLHHLLRALPLLLLHLINNLLIQLLRLLLLNKREHIRPLRVNHRILIHIIRILVLVHLLRLLPNVPVPLLRQVLMPQPINALVRCARLLHPVARAV